MSLSVERVSCDQLNLSAAFDVGVKLYNSGRTRIAAGSLVIKASPFWSEDLYQRECRNLTDLDPGESTWVSFRLSSEENKFVIVEYRPHKGSIISFGHRYKAGFFKATRIA